MNLYLDLFSGISGDMLCGALLNLGVPFDYLKSELEKLGLDGYNLEYKISNVNGIACGDFDVVCEHIDHHHHHHNSLSEILSLIDKSSISQRAKEYASKVFNVLGEAEAKVHNTNIENLHFHEVGAVDSIIDIVGGAICLDYLNVEKIYFGDLPSFSGEIKCAHGIIPLPGPAVCELTTNMKWNNLNEIGELITPTGAAFLKALGTQINPNNPTYNKTGYGCGKRQTQRGNYLRAFLFDSEIKDNSIIDIEFNIDDMTGELHENLFEEFNKAGALDVMFLSGMMKKQRLGILVKVLCKEKDFESVCDAIFLNSTTIGIRFNKKDRICLERKNLLKNTEYGEINFKETYYKDKLINSKPEYEDLKKISKEINISIKSLINELK